MEHKEKHLSLISKNVKIYDLVKIALMAAITFVLTSAVHVPSFMGVVHLGDSMIFLGAVLIGRKKGAVSAAIGMSLFDILNGYTFWAPFTFLIKGVMGFIAGSIAYRKNNNGEKVINNLVGFILAGLFMIVAYYFSGVIMARFIIFKAGTIQQAFLIAIKDIPGNIAQVVAGIIIALPLSITLKRALKSANIEL